MVYFVGAGCGAHDLITVRAKKILQCAQIVVYAGSLINKSILSYTQKDCTLHDSSKMTLEEIIAVIAAHKNCCCVRLHSGDPCLYGAIREQMEALDTRRIPYEIVPGVSSFCGAAAAVRAEYTVPGVSQSVIITRMQGRTPVPDGESLARLSSHGCSMVLFLSASLLLQAQAELLAGGAYTPDTPAAIVYKASWPEEKVYRCTVGTLAQTAALHGITHTALILVGSFLGDEYRRSLLYSPSFSTGVRTACAPPADKQSGIAVAQRFSRIYIASVTRQGGALAAKLTQLLCASGANAVCTVKPDNLRGWFEQGFAGQGGQKKALVFIGAAGIAVRCAAPFITSKMTDPALIVLDEAGQFAIPVLSGHVGMANELASYIAEQLACVPVITTATDIHHTWSVDAWAQAHNFCIASPHEIKRIASAVLRDEPVSVFTDLPQTAIPAIPYDNYRYAEQAKEADIIISRSSAYRNMRALRLIPRDAVLGVGCKKDMDTAKLQSAFLQFCRAASLEPECFYKACSIQLKENESAIRDLCAAFNLLWQVFSADELRAVSGVFSYSDFTQQVTGVDCVCERSAAAGVLADTADANWRSYLLIAKKQRFEGSTFAAAVKSG